MKGEQFKVRNFNLGDGQKVFSFSRRVKGTFGVTVKVKLEGGGTFKIVKDLDNNGFDAGDQVLKVRSLSSKGKVIHQAPALKGDYLIVIEGGKGAKGSLDLKVRKMYQQSGGDDLLGGAAGVSNDNSVTNITINTYTTNYYPSTSTVDVVNPTATTPAPTPTTSSSTWTATLTGPQDNILTGGSGSNPIAGTTDVLHQQCLALTGVHL